MSPGLKPRSLFYEKILQKTSFFEDLKNVNNSEIH